MMEPMSKYYVKFVKGFSLYTLVILAISLAVWWWIPKIPISSSFLYIIGFIFAFTLLVFYQLTKSLEGKLSRFFNVFMLLNFFKLMLYLVVIVGYALLNREGAIPFIITFFVYYLVFTVYEIVALLKRKPN